MVHEGDQLDSTDGGSSAGSSRGKPHRGERHTMDRLDSSSAGYKRRACGGEKDGPPAKKANKESRLHTVRNAYEISFFSFAEVADLERHCSQTSYAVREGENFSFFPPHL